ncbi:hypothetical protein AAG570_002939 [Ranatra chinensis]|uniref:serine--tRNA ligase n=1 Tax=Ranatra chinensis TaxID=642074 RepID=A0ABD0Y5S2_9HEMI
MLNLFFRHVSSCPHLPKPDFDFTYICEAKNRDEIAENIKRRKSTGDIDLILRLYEKLKGPVDSKQDIEEELMGAVSKIPNRSHPDILKLNEEPDTVNIIGEKRKFTFKPLNFQEISKRLNLARTDGLTNLTGPRSYFLMDDLARLEHALIDYSVRSLLQKCFQLVSVPDILDRGIIEGCGMDTRGERNQVYSLDTDHGNDLCLSGTAEMGIARLLMNQKFSSSELPARFAAVSRCYRAETSKVSEEKGLYRVHQFTKVEMFGVCKPADSDRLLEELTCLQEENFSRLGLHIRTLDMPPCELGQPAYRKFDVEGYMAGRGGRWGELSSASNCTDFQSRRLNITSEDGNYLHTVNGTCCAIPRMLIAIFETHQRNDGSVQVPPPLVPFMGIDVIGYNRMPTIRPYKQRLESSNSFNKQT